MPLLNRKEGRRLQLALGKHPFHAAEWGDPNSLIMLRDHNLTGAFLSPSHFAGFPQNQNMPKGQGKRDWHVSANLRCETHEEMPGNR